VQARTIHGGVHVHAAPAAPWPWTPRQLPPRPAYFTDRAGPLTLIGEAAAHRTRYRFVTVTLQFADFS
jgi:hypothetical protein